MTPSRILVVDDGASNRKLLRAVLERAGYAVLEAADGVEALAMLEREKVDVVISDILMPRMDGYRLCHEVRRNEKTRDIPFIFHTATYTSPADERLSLDLGGSTYLRKPVAAKVLLEAIQQAVRAPAARPSERARSLDDIGVMQMYGEQLVIKLEEKNVELEQTNAALKSSEARFRELAEHIQDVFYSFDPATKQMLYVSPAYETIWGRSCQSLYDRPLSYLDAIHLEDRPMAQAALDQRARGAETDSEYRVVQPDGAVRWVRDRSFVVPGAAGVTQRVVGIVKDVTDRHEAEERLRMSEAQYRMLFESNPNPMWVFDLDSLQFLAVNEAAVERYGFSKEEFLGMTILDIRPSEDVPDLRHELATRQPDQRRFGVRRHRRKDGTIFQVEITSEGIVLDGRRARLALAHDVTERERQAERLREQASLLDKAQDAILVRDLEHRITYWNKSAERLYGWTAEEALGRSAVELLYRDPTAFGAATARVLAAGEWVGELQQVARDGRKLTIESRWTLVRDAADNPRSVLSTNTDVTEKRKLEQQFLRAQRMESLGTLAGGIAHDLNNVLAPILLSIDLLRQTITDEESRQTLATIAESAQRGGEMVRRVLGFARGMDGRRIEVEPENLIADVEKIVRDTFPKSVRVVTRVSDDLRVVQGDPTQLHQVLLNLCVNARDAMPEGGRLAISAENATIDAQEASLALGAAVGPHVRLEVEDTGTGIASSDLDKIFDPFFTTKEVGQGTGLGLSTSLAIVKSHGGFIRVYSEPGKGTRFQIFLPAESAAARPSAAAEAALLPRGNGETVLVVDDEASVRQITRQTLEAFGYRVLLASDGAEAVALYAQRRDEIDVVLTDMMMPILDGAATINALLRIEPEVRIVAASGLTVDGALRAVSAGVRQFLSKPYTAEAMLRSLKQVLTDGR